MNCVYTKISIMKSIHDILLFFQCKCMARNVSKPVLSSKRFAVPLKFLGIPSLDIPNFVYKTCFFLSKNVYFSVKTALTFIYTVLKNCILLHNMPTDEQNFLPKFYFNILNIRNTDYLKRKLIF